MNWLVEIFVKVGFDRLFKFLAGELDKRKEAQRNHDLGASRAESQGRVVIQEIGNDQAARPSQHINPDDDNSLSEFLRGAPSTPGK